MAKQDTAEKYQSAVNKLIEDRQNALSATFKDNAESIDRIKQRRAQMTLAGARLVRFEEMIRRKDTKQHRISVDLLGGGVAVVSSELLNWGLRALGNWSKDGFWAHNVDLLQGLPHFLAGLGLYLTDMATRGQKLTMKREVFGEAMKLLSVLGAANTMRALRGRWVEGKDASQRVADLAAEHGAMKERLERLGEKS